MTDASGPTTPPPSPAAPSAARPHAPPAPATAPTALSRRNGWGSKDKNRKTSRGTPTLLPWIAALAAGLAVWLAGRSEYRGSAVFRLTEEASPDRARHVREELLDFVWSRLDGSAPSRDGVLQWTVESIDPSDWRLSLVTDSRRTAFERIRSLAEAFLRHLRQQTERTLSTPSEPEAMLQETVSRLEERLDRARRELDAAAGTDDTERLPQRETLMERWRKARDVFDRKRADLVRLQTHRDELVRDGVPAFGVVSHDDREQALLADDALQQDLKELTVRLTQVKLQMLHVRQRASARLESLRRASKEMHDRLARPPDDAEPEPPSTPEALSAGAAAYDEELT
ncbi:MAG: hypothetical protein D6788_07415, partial [Planctomycetota bacterium]